MSSTGKHARLFEELPADLAALVRIVQGLAIHEYMASAYGVTVSDERKGESHIRRIEKMLDRLLAIDSQPLSTARPPERRLVGVCHHFALLLVAMLRAGGVPARYRCGLGAFFKAPYFEEHLVCEYWNAAEERWVRGDGKLDTIWQRGIRVKLGPLDVPRDSYVG